MLIHNQPPQVSTVTVRRWVFSGVSAPDLLPDFAPQPVALGAGVVLADVRLDADRRRFRKFLGRCGLHVLREIGHHVLLIAARKDSSLRNNEVLSAPR